MLCQKEVKVDKEKCKIPMFSELKAGGHKKAYCVLTEGKDGKRLTQPHWSKVINIHEKPKTAAVAKKPEEPKPKAPKPEPKAEEKKEEKEKRDAERKAKEAEEAKKEKEEDKKEKVVEKKA